MASNGSDRNAKDALSKLSSNPSTLGESFFRARITEAHFEDKNNQAVDTIIGDQEDPDVKNKREVKKADDREIENIKDKEGKNVEDQQDSEGDDDTNNDDKADHKNNKSTQENRVLKSIDVSGEKSREVFSVMPWATKGGRRVLCYVQGSGRRKRKKSVGCSNRRRDCALFGALVFLIFNPGPGSFAHKQIWDPRI
ncbi:hypothetical protein Tco_0282620 [Tanacetum coccineum]